MQEGEEEAERGRMIETIGIITETEDLIIISTKMPETLLETIGTTEITEIIETTTGITIIEIIETTEITGTTEKTKITEIAETT